MLKQEKVFDVFDKLKAEIEKASSGNFIQEQRYLSLLRAALSKNFEFNLFLWQSETKYSFFSTATLRGILEDIITFSFLKSLSEDDKNIISEKIILLKLLQRCETQADFFDKKEPFQPVFKFKVQLEGNIKQNQSELKEGIKAIVKKYPQWQSKPSDSDGFPKIQNMAKECGLEEIYKYLYVATSEWVHFNPHVLLRMGWGNDKDDNSNFMYNASTENFNIYYLDFTRFYGTYLFTIFCNLFKEDFLFSEQFNKLVETLRIDIDETIRWPEIITFEEMNVKPPSAFMYALSHIVHSSKTKKAQ